MASVTHARAVAVVGRAMGAFKPGTRTFRGWLVRYTEAGVKKRIGPHQVRSDATRGRRILRRMVGVTDVRIVRLVRVRPSTIKRATNVMMDSIRNVASSARTALRILGGAR